MNSPAVLQFWRHSLLLVIVLGSLASLLSLKPFGQPLGYHDFADRRTVLGVPNFMDVTSNLPFLFIGIAGLWLYHRRFPGAAITWAVFFGGVALVSIGSAHYHWRPNNGTLVWDRLPMTIAFTAMFVALLSEFINPKLRHLLLAPALLVGVLSVIYWHVYDDLRFYVWVQLVPLLTIPTVMALFRSRYSHGWLLLVGLGCYLLAKLAESLDREVFAATNRVVGGHAIKHLLAAACCFVIFEMLRRRKAVVSAHAE